MSEYEHRKKLNKIREDVNNRAKDIRDHFAKIEKVKTDALKRVEDMRVSAERDLIKLEADISKVELPSTAKSQLVSDIATLRREIEEKGTELRNRLSKTVIPP